MKSLFEQIKIDIGSYVVSIVTGDRGERVKTASAQAEAVFIYFLSGAAIVYARQA